MTSETVRQRANDTRTRATQHADDTRNSARDQRKGRANHHATTRGTAPATDDHN